jgi:hypothetical protein
MVMGFTFPVNALCLKAHSFWPTVLLHASHNVFVRSIFHAATVNGPYTQYYQLFLLFVLPIKIRMSQMIKAIPHNSKCRYGKRGAADAKPKAQIILDVLSSILATQMPCRSCRSGA